MVDADVATQHVDDVAGFDRQLPPRGFRGVHARFGADALEHARRFEQPAGRQIAGRALERMGRRAEGVGVPAGHRVLDRGQPHRQVFEEQRE